MLRLLSTLMITDAHAFKRFDVSKCFLHRTIERGQIRAFSAVSSFLLH